MFQNGDGEDRRIARMPRHRQPQQGPGRGAEQRQPGDRPPGAVAHHAKPGRGEKDQIGKQGERRRRLGRNQDRGQETAEDTEKRDRRPVQ